MERLLREAEHRTELALHLVRGLLWLGLGLGGLTLVASSGMLPRVWAFAVVLWLGTTAGYVALWRVLSGPHYHPQLKYALVVVDAMFIGRIFVAERFGVLKAIGIGDLPFTPQEIAALAPLYLLLVAASGAARFSPRAAVWSTLVSLTVYQLMASTFGVDLRQNLVQSLLLVMGGGLATAASRGLRTLVQRAEREGVMQRYVPEALVAEIARADDVSKLGRQEEVSVLFADIRGFTHRSETLTPQQSVELLNAYFSTVVAAIVAERGVTDKYIGDGVLAFFEGPEHAARAARAAVGMLHGIDAYNQARPDALPLRIGVAVNTGEALVGTVGAPSRKEYTVIGDVVNVASRLEEMNKKLPAVCTLAAHTFQSAGTAVADALRGFQGPTTVPIRGHEGDLAVYYLPPSASAAVGPALVPVIAGRGAR